MDGNRWRIIHQNSHVVHINNTSQLSPPQNKASFTFLHKECRICIMALGACQIGTWKVNWKLVIKSHEAFTDLKMQIQMLEFSGRQGGTCFRREWLEDEFRARTAKERKIRVTNCWELCRSLNAHQIVWNLARSKLLLDLFTVLLTPRLRFACGINRATTNRSPEEEEQQQQEDDGGGPTGVEGGQVLPFGD